VEVGIRELKNGLSRYLAAVRGGQEIAVTDRGTVVARLIPAEPRAIERLIRDGLVERAPRRRKQARTAPKVGLTGEGPTMAGYVADQRG
jgi:prevent-host-death family protein